MESGKKTIIIVAGLAIVGLILFFGYGKNFKPWNSILFGKQDHFVLKKLSQPNGTDDGHKLEIKISGSQPVISLMKAMAIEFEREHEDIKLTFLPPTHSKGGVMGVIKKEYDFGLVSRRLKPEEAHDGLHYIHFANDPLVFAVHNNVKVKNLSVEQIKQIYSGQITNWQQVGGDDIPVVVLDRPEHTSAKILMRKLLFGKDLKIVDNAINLERPPQMVQSLKVLDNSIGYTSLGEVIYFKKELSILQVDNVLPTIDNVTSGKYPYFRPFAWVLGPNPGP